MKSFNRRDSHGNHGSKHRELAQHAHSHGSHSFAHTLTSTQLHPRGAKRQLSYSFSVHAGSFRLSVIHRTLTWTTGSLSCVPYVIILVRAYTHGGLGTPTARQHNICLTLKNSLFFSCAPDWIRIFVLWIHRNLGQCQISLVACTHQAWQVHSRH